VQGIDYSVALQQNAVVSDKHAGDSIAPRAKDLQNFLSSDG
jgi:hypothetical protein